MDAGSGLLQKTIRRDVGRLSLVEVEMLEEMLQSQPNVAVHPKGTAGLIQEDSLLSQFFDPSNDLLGAKEIVVDRVRALERFGH